MVGVEVAQHQQRDVPHPQLAQTAVHRHRVGTGVHHHRRAVPGGQRQRVALAHIAHHQPPARRRPAGERPAQPLHRCGPQDRREQQQHADHAQHGAAQRPPQQRHHRHRQHPQQRGPGPAAGPAQFGPGQPGPGTGDPGDHPGRPARQPGQHLGDRHGHRGAHQRGPAQHQRRGEGEFGQQIRGHGDQADPLGEHRHHRSAHHLRRPGRRQSLREAPRHPPGAQRGAPPWCEGQQRAGGQHRQQKAERPGQRRVVQHQQQRGGGQCRQQRTAPPGGDREQRDPAAHGRPQHTRARPADEDEPHQQPAAQHGRAAQPDPQPPGQPAPLGPPRRTGRSDQHEQDDRQMGAAHHNDVREIGGLDRLPQLGRDPRGVADDQCRNQGPRVLGQPLGGLAQRLAQQSGEPLGAARLGGDLWRTVVQDPQHGGELAAPAGHRLVRPGLDQQPGGGQHGRPLRQVSGRRPGHHHDRIAPVGRARHDDHLAPLGPGHLGVAADLHLDGGAFADRLRERAAPYRRAVQRGHHRPGGGRGQRHGHGHPQPRAGARQHRHGQQDRPAGRAERHHQWSVQRRRGAGPGRPGGRHQPQIRGPVGRCRAGGRRLRA